MLRSLALIAALSALVLFSGCDDANGQDTSQTENAQPAAPLPPAVRDDAANSGRSKLEVFLEARGPVVIENQYLVGRTAFREDKGMRKSDLNAYRMTFHAVVAHNMAAPEQQVRGMEITISTSGPPGVCYLDEEQVGELVASVDRFMAALPEWDRTHDVSHELKGAEPPSHTSEIGVSVGALHIASSYRAGGPRLPRAGIEITREPKGWTWLTREELADVKRLAQRCQQVLASNDPAAAARKAVKEQIDDAADDY